MTLLMYDNAYPLANPPASDIVLIYSGGDAVHIWTTAEIAGQPARYRLPTFVRSNPTNATADANAMIAWLHANGVPTGTATVLDLETAVYAQYVASYGTLLNQAGYSVLPYGSISTLFKNPELNGYFSAHPGATSIDANCVATQFGYDGAYDLSWVSDAVPLWDTRPPLTPPTPTAASPQESNNMATDVPTGGQLAVRPDGGVFAYGGARFYGSLPGLGVKVSNIVGIAATSTGNGYWLVGSDGGIFCFGDAVYHGSGPGNKDWNIGTASNPVVGITRDDSQPSGYVIFAANPTGAAPNTYACNQTDSYA